ncbi:diguanylate cyclase [Aureimonas sp. AU12]|uniref:GGDEF domain-containing protein n=1 Tax=Aureimonas sp. AU12 TaxID=1638161 RepID=UPI00078650F7|nr:GGDEF domain-containing protein [Aureimonas sp. AU12]
MPFDLETLHLSSALSRGAYLVVFLVVALRQPRELCLWHWIGAILTSMIGSALMAAVPPTRWLTSGEALIIYTCYAASLILSWSGLRLFNQRRIAPAIVMSMIALPGIAYVTALVVGVPMRSALASVFVLMAVYAGVGAVEAVRRKPEQRLWSAYIVSATLSLYALTLSATLVMLLGTDIPMNSTESAMISMIVDQASGILVYFGYIAMAKEHAVLMLEQIAATDPLTGLVNRRGFQAALARRLERSTGREFAGILMADIDHFKSINDTHGHEAGDAVLITFAQRLSEALRKHDIVARWGGEEFLAVLPDVGTGPMAAIAEQLRQVIEAEPFLLPNGKPIRITISIGISEMPPALTHFEPATRRADGALYDAKRNGRNKVCRTPYESEVMISTAMQA